MFARSSLMFSRRLFTKTPRAYVANIKESLRWSFIGSGECEECGMNMYETAADRIKYDLWFDHFKLDDTFASWFAITELHVWMCAQRIMGDPYKRRAEKTREYLFRYLWRDCEQRMKMLGPIASSQRQEGIDTLADRLKLMLFVYDEGFAIDDQMLACALWRGVFSRKENFDEFYHLRTLIHYVRNNVDHLDKIPLTSLFEEKNFEWKPLEDSVEVSKRKSLTLD